MKVFVPLGRGRDWDSEVSERHPGLSNVRLPGERA